MPEKDETTTAPSGPHSSISAIGPVQVPKASDVLAEHLRQQILDGTLPEGSALPVERVLASTVGLGRGTVRDALRVLEIEGLVVTRPGRAGGSFVRRPDTSTLQRSLNVLVSGHGVKLGAVLEAREAIEPAAARFAAQHRTDEDLERLDAAATGLAAAAKAGDIPVFLQCNVDWHVAVGVASHNEIIEIITNSLSSVVLRSTDVQNFNNEKTMALTIRAHDKILQSIRDRDPEGAAQAMNLHVHTYRTLVEKVVPPDVDL